MGFNVENKDTRRSLEPSTAFLKMSGLDSMASQRGIVQLLGSTRTRTCKKSFDTSVRLLQRSNRPLRVYYDATDDLHEAHQTAISPFVQDCRSTSAANRSGILSSHAPCILAYWLVLGRGGHLGSISNRAKFERLAYSSYLDAREDSKVRGFLYLAAPRCGYGLE